MKKIGVLLLLSVLTFLWSTCGEGPDKVSENDAPGIGQAEENGFSTPRQVSQDVVTVPVSPEESLGLFRLPKGYSLEVVASEPMISEPAAIAWDGNGRMYVAQLESYMQTIDARGQDQPVSRVMLLEDTDGDGKMDKSSVFIDKLLAPRMILCVGREVLVNETNTFDIYAYQDTDGDGKADVKRAVFKPGKDAYGNIEHQRAGLDWNLDNWIYLTLDPIRFRYRNGQLIADSLRYGSNGQWGLTHDDEGRVFFSRAASGTAATGFHINPAYGQLEMHDRVQDSLFALVWPLAKNPDANDRLREDSTLIRFTAVCGQSVFRGDRLPESLRGDYLVAEPVGRLIRRAKIDRKDGIASFRNAYEQDEFIASRDMNFRPVNTYTGPDGCLYIVDMYRGIIQESTWVTPEMKIYSQIKSKGLDRNVRNGRIYRVVYEGMTPGPKPSMLDDATSKLVTYLDHPNGWWRDNAQKEIIVRQDRSVVPALKQIWKGERGPLASKPSPLARLHALWTLEGLDAISRADVLAALGDSDAQIRKAAVRLSEPFIMKNDAEMLDRLRSLGDDGDAEVIAQLVLSIDHCFAGKERELVNGIVSDNDDHPLISALGETLARNEEARQFGSKLQVLKPADRKLVMNGNIIFKSLCTACHGPEGKGLPSAIAPPLISKFKLIAKRDAVIRIMLHGLEGPVDGKTYPEKMIAMGANSDEWIASVLNYVRYDLGMKSFPDMPYDYLNWVIIQPEDVAKVREKYADRKEPWTWEELSQKK